MPPLFPGRIIWAVSPGNRGNNERRPMIVATTRTDIIKNGCVRVVVCSTKFSVPLAEHEVPLPWNPEGHPRTLLRKATAAICDWIDVIPVSSIENSDCGGSVAGELLKEIINKAGIEIKPSR